MLVVGCKQPVSSGDDAWTVKESKKLVWEKTSDPEVYLRAFEEFQATANSNRKSGLVKVEVGNMGTSKAAAVFGIENYAENTYRYFLVGIGGNQYSNTPEYFISYYYDVDIASLSQSTNNEKPSGSMVTIANNTSASGSMATIENKAIAYVSFKEEAVENKTDVKKITVKIGPENNGKEATGDNLITKEFYIGVGITTENDSLADVQAGEDKTKLKAFSSIKGGIGAYGMIKKGSGLTTKNSYELVFSSISAAEDAE